MRKMKISKKGILFSLLFVLTILYFCKFNQILFYPSNFQIIKGENKNLDVSFPFSLEYEKQDNIVEPIFSEEKTPLKKSYNLQAEQTGNSQFQIKLLGLLPVKNYNVNVVNRPYIAPGGSAIGVSFNTQGVLVVAITDVIDADGKRTSPAKDAGLKVGDSITKINNKNVTNAEQVVKTLNNIKKEEINITVTRNNKEFTTSATPIQSLQDNSYRLGIWVRDKTTGIGTLTYYNLEDNTFGALGHGITDADTGELLTVKNGLIMRAKVSDIEHGKKGTPGEMKGVFYKTDEVLGDIEFNNEFGIYGNLKDKFSEKNELKSIPIAFKEEIKQGKAHLLTTLDDNHVEKFEVEILKVETQDKKNPKSMVIKITDEDLLAKTGGIVQGMSGSPLIQDGKIIGAVTHVFVNDPTKGYGLFIEWMLNQEDKS